MLGFDRVFDRFSSSWDVPLVISCWFTWASSSLGFFRGSGGTFFCVLTLFKVLTGCLVHEIVQYRNAR